MKGGRRHGGEKKRWEDNVREWTGLEFAKSQRAVENWKKMEETGCEIICGASTTLAVKELMMMMIFLFEVMARATVGRVGEGEEVIPVIATPPF